MVYFLIVRIIVVLASLSGFLFATVTQGGQLENLSTLSHLAHHESPGDHHPHEHDGGHTSSGKFAHSLSVSVSHSHDKHDSDEEGDSPHEHTLNISQSFVTLIGESIQIEYSVDQSPSLLRSEPDQLISNLFRAPLFRPPIS